MKGKMKALRELQRNAAPPITPGNLVQKMRRIRWELAITKTRTKNPAVASELDVLVRQTDDAIDRIEARHQEERAE